jgi:SAM-dependent methyltransferase
MTRTELINQLLLARRGTRYLEIGVRAEVDNLAHIRCPHKVGVDVEPVTTFHGTSDEFFSQNDDRFDVIFIDGLHTEQQAAKDIANAYRALVPGGAIVLHDCMPPDAWHQREPEAVSPGENWNGTVWKAALREFNRTEHRCEIVATDWGCGVIDTAREQVPACSALPADLEYERHYAWLLEYEISVETFVRDRVRVFYHLACIGNWRDVFAGQMSLLRRSGFRSIDLTVLGETSDMGEVDAICERSRIDARTILRSAELTLFETPTLRAIEDYARGHHGHVLYLHSKGVSNPGDGTKARWRKVMMRELVENWEPRMRELAHYDAIGVNWRDMPPLSHFCGNFWYASTSYLRTLADFQTYYDHPRYRIWDAINDKRLGCEFWIGSGATAPQVLSLVCRNEDFCSPAFWCTDRWKAAGTAPA